MEKMEPRSRRSTPNLMSSQRGRRSKLVENLLILHLSYATDDDQIPIHLISFISKYWILISMIYNGNNEPSAVFPFAPLHSGDSCFSSGPINLWDGLSDWSLKLSENGIHTSQTILEHDDSFYPTYSFVHTSVDPSLHPSIHPKVTS
jgi:hypothetical protein